jgi:hypothetical protein
MTKSQVSAVFHVLEGLFEDAQRAYPEDGGLSLDKERLAHYVKTRGLGLFTLDLPSLNSLLLRGLESGRLELEGPLSSAVSKRIRVPKLFRGLWLRVFSRDSRLRPDVDVTAVAFLRQFTCLGKNITVVCSPSRILATKEKYYDVERTLRGPTLQWDLDRIDVRVLQSLSFADCIASGDDWTGSLFYSARGHGENRAQGGERQTSDARLLGTLQQVADLFSSAIPFVEPVTYSMSLEAEGRGIGFKHGPGAVAEKLKNHEKSGFLYWPAKLQDWFPYELCGRTAGSTDPKPLNHEVASRLLLVPKTAKSPRIIACEPTAHQWCQQLVWKWLEEWIRATFKGDFINFRRQEFSGRMVLSASRDRKSATVDLSDASDRLSCWTVERIFRLNPALLSVLHAARTRHLVVDNPPPGSDSFIKLKKFATQGTATTFPVQSMVFLIIGLAACLTDEKVDWQSVKKLRKKVRTYGDDIIIPTYGYVRLCRIMELLQLKVNKDKSYVTGHYRESCGVDGYLGHDVTPCSPETFVAGGPPSRQAVMDTSNNLFNKGYWNASDRLKSMLPIRVQRGVRIVDIREGGFAGLTSFCGSDESHLVKRWNPRLHRYEGRVWSLRSSSSERDRQGYTVLLDFVSRSYDARNPRVTSTYGCNRKSRDGLLWEPLNSGALGYPPLPERDARDRFIRLGRPPR